MSLFGLFVLLLQLTLPSATPLIAEGPQGSCCPCILYPWRGRDPQENSDLACQTCVLDLLRTPQDLRPNHNNEYHDYNSKMHRDEYSQDYGHDHIWSRNLVGHNHHNVIRNNHLHITLDCNYHSNCTGHLISDIAYYLCDNNACWHNYSIYSTNGLLQIHWAMLRLVVRPNFDQSSSTLRAKGCSCYVTSQPASTQVVTATTKTSSTKTSTTTVSTIFVPFRTTTVTLTVVIGAMSTTTTTSITTATEQSFSTVYETVTSTTTSTATGPTVTATVTVPVGYTQTHRKDLVFS
ncbi:uncharacterized protein CC84DRAFT_1230422 [Paraphaeosphaeria sporulosa]|uniref:Uncharacterized protein n=1 Tax=Paraphaeosphaeria sporulosa TaxID=1460663 RepID=A0A177BY16_9PLEO|nr:uncharacterized protein CC84DRAFT_1230422 [Paraphaeosphaeria sporulosa]OAG00414.1 hypothetical protein CC84DRAFT_1230422 [Paraphaeosphaeria sporulosa]